MGETSKWTAQREMTLIDDMDCSFNRLIEKGNKLAAERDRYKAEAEYEHRRRVAAEAVIEKCKHCVWHNHTGLCPDKCEPYIKWQSIIKEG